MKIGQVRWRVTFQEAVDTPDSGGGYTRTWQNIASAPHMFAQVRSVTQKDMFQGQGLKDKTAFYFDSALPG